MKIDYIDVLLIKKEASKIVKINVPITEGQAIFIAAQNKFPEAVSKLKNTEFDCFYDDSRIDLFLTELQKIQSYQLTLTVNKKVRMVSYVAQLVEPVEIL